MMRQYELVERVKAYDPDADEALLNKAYVYSMKKHGAQKRASGDPYFSHPLEVAGILTRLKLDADTIATALLHDTIEDTDATLEDIERLFGKNVARLVNGVTKLSMIELKSSENRQAENFRKLVLAMSEDIRVLLVKLADRLHNMKTLHYIPKPEKRERIARETMEIYAPLAERIGMHDIKDELQDLAFKELHPEARESILNRLAYLRDSGGSVKDTIEAQLRDDLLKAGIPAVVYGREKKPYSIWRKMQHKNINLEQLSDIMAFRVMVDSPSQCYAALGVFHSEYQIVPGRFKDYISIRKPNGYQSLHTTLMGPGNHRIEIQIRTHEMHEVAELGVAAHWVYKQGEGVTEGKQFRWLRELLDLLEDAPNSEEFLEHTKIAMYQDQVFCFSPKGDLVALQRGATPVDFAYAVHSAVGDACMGSRVNGRIVPLRHVLSNGDQVEILTQKGHQPSPTWEEFVVSAKAKAAVRRFVRAQSRDQYIELGKGLLEKAFKESERSLTDAALLKVLEHFGARELNDLYATIGQGQHHALDVLLALYPDLQQAEKVQRQDAFVNTLLERKETVPQTRGKHASLPVSGLIPGMAMHYAKCCHPVPGDQIVGIIATGRGVTIHTRDCDNLKAVENQPERWVDVSWDSQAIQEDQHHVARLQVFIENAPGSLGNMCTIIGQSKANIHNLKISNRNTDLYEIFVDVEIDDTSHLATVMAALRSNRGVTSVERMKQ